MVYDFPFFNVIYALYLKNSRMMCKIRIQSNWNWQKYLNLHRSGKFYIYTPHNKYYNRTEFLAITAGQVSEQIVWSTKNEVVQLAPIVDTFPGASKIFCLKGTEFSLL